MSGQVRLSKANKKPEPDFERLWPIFHLRNFRPQPAPAASFPSQPSVKLPLSNLIEVNRHSRLADPSIRRVQSDSTGVNRTQSGLTKVSIRLAPLVRRPPGRWRVPRRLEWFPVGGQNGR